jgi:hypothetical protein
MFLVSPVPARANGSYDLQCKQPLVFKTSIDPSQTLDLINTLKDPSIRWIYARLFFILIFLCQWPLLSLQIEHQTSCYTTHFSLGAVGCTTTYASLFFLQHTSLLLCTVDVRPIATLFT